MSACTARSRPRPRAPQPASLAAQQRKFNTFREEFNHERPHEALDMQTPASLLPPLTAARCPSKLPPLEYPDRFEVRYVSANGGIRWKQRVWVNVSTVCIGEYVGLEEIDDGIWNVYFGPLQTRPPTRAAHADRGCLWTPRTPWRLNTCARITSSATLRRRFAQRHRCS